MIFPPELINLVLFLDGSDLEVEVIPEFRHPAPAGMRGASPAHPMPRTSAYLYNGSPRLPNFKDPPKSPLSPPFPSAPRCPRFPSDPRCPRFPSTPKSQRFPSAPKCSLHTSAPKSQRFPSTPKSPRFPSPPRVRACRATPGVRTSRAPQRVSAFRAPPKVSASRVPQESALLERRQDNFAGGLPRHGPWKSRIRHGRLSPQIRQRAPQHPHWMLYGVGRAFWGNVRPVSPCLVSPFLLCPYMVLPVSYS